MGLGATIVGTAYGVSTMLITNAMRKTALFQRPWEIVIAGGVGAFVANQAMDFEHFLEVRVQEMARDRILNNKEVMEEEYRQILGPRFDKWFPEGVEGERQKQATQMLTRRAEVDARIAEVHR